MLVRQLSPTFCARRVVWGWTRPLEKCLRGVFPSWRSPKLKCLRVAFAVVLLGAAGWIRDLQRSFLTCILFFCGCCVQHRTLIYQWSHHGRAARLLSSAVASRSCPQQLLPCTESLILCSTYALRSKPDLVLMVSRCIWGCGCSLSDSDHWH